MICGNCQAPTESVATVRACFAGDREPCGWVVRVGFNEDGAVFAPCGAHVTFTERGWSCENGHEHVTMETRHAERWDYAEDHVEAARMAAHGIQAVSMRNDAVTVGPV